MCRAKECSAPELFNFLVGLHCDEKFLRLLSECLCIQQVRTQTLVKSAIIQVDATPFKQYYQQHYGVEVGLKKKSAAATAAAAAAAEEDKKADEDKKSSHVLRKLKARNQNRKLDEVRLCPLNCPNCLFPSTA